MSEKENKKNLKPRNEYFDNGSLIGGFYLPPKEGYVTLGDVLLAGVVKAVQRASVGVRNLTEIAYKKIR